MREAGGTSPRSPAELGVWVDARAWTTGDGPKALFDASVAWLRERRVLLPGVTTLARLVAQVRRGSDRAAVATRCYGPVDEHRSRCPGPGCWTFRAGARTSELDRLRHGPVAGVGTGDGLPRWSGPRRSPAWAWARWTCRWCRRGGWRSCPGTGWRQGDAAEPAPADAAGRPRCWPRSSTWRTTGGGRRAGPAGRADHEQAAGAGRAGERPRRS